MDKHSRRSPVPVVILAAALFAVVAAVPWHVDRSVRSAAAIVVTTLVLWIAEFAPLGVVALLIPVAATFTGILNWGQAVAPWGDRIVFLFLGAFLLARALDKYGLFDFLLRSASIRRLRSAGGHRLALAVMLLAGLASTVQNNTAVAAALLPIVSAMARGTPTPAIALLALSYGATFGGMATPVGTAPNFIGYAAMKSLDPAVNFLMWLKVGVPVWIGTTLLAAAVFRVAAYVRQPANPLQNPSDSDPHNGLPVIECEPIPEQRETVGEQAAGAKEAIEATFARGRSLAATDAVERAAAGPWVIAAFAAVIAAWLGAGVVVSLTGADHPARVWVERYLPESLAPILAAAILFIVRVGPANRPILDRHDLQGVDWDTLFLIAGGLCLGKVMETSGAAAELACAVSGAHLPPFALMLALGGVTVLLSELTSNTATASLMVPIAAGLAPHAGLSAVQTIWLVALSASLGFALPVSTPPNALVYGTRLVPLRTMAGIGVVVDVLSLLWVVTCIRWLA